MNSLSADEIERAGRFHFEKDKNNFISCRGILRRILADYTGLRPEDIRFEYTSNGKPYLSVHTNTLGLNFNLSHSGTLALYAFSIKHLVGIDIEYIRLDLSIEEIANRFFSENEIISIKSHSKISQQEVFFQYWVRKEAVLKAEGIGVSFEMNNIDVSSINSRGQLDVMINEDDYRLWFIQDLFPEPGYCGAVALNEKNYKLSLLNFIF